MDKTEKEAMIAELTERLRSSDSLIVADYRGLSNAEFKALRGRLRDHGAKLQVVKNTLTRRAAEAAGSEALLALLEGPIAIAFVEAEGDPIAVAKALADAASETKILSLRGGVLAGKAMSEAEVVELAKLPPVDLLKAQLLGVIVAPLTELLGLIDAPLRDLVGLLDARIEQLGDSAEADSPREEVEGHVAAAEEPNEPEAVELLEETPSGNAGEPEAEPVAAPAAEAETGSDTPESDQNENEEE